MNCYWALAVYIETLVTLSCCDPEAHGGEVIYRGTHSYDAGNQTLTPNLWLQSYCPFHEAALGLIWWSFWCNFYILKRRIYFLFTTFYTASFLLLPSETPQSLICVCFGSLNLCLEFLPCFTFQTEVNCHLLQEAIRNNSRSHCSFPLSRLPVQD